MGKLVCFAALGALMAATPVLAAAAETGPEGLARIRPPLPAIAIVIDDLGHDRDRAREAMALPAGVSLAFLPDPPAAFALSREAHAAGHQILLHLPMEPNGRQNPGSMALRLDQSEEENLRRLNWALSRVSSFEGVNNHMGSRFTTSRDALRPVMRELSRRGLFFLDSVTVPLSQGVRAARESGVAAGRRDVFLDDERSAGAVQRGLDAAEAHARAFGTAIAIGHPHGETLAALKRWSTAIEDRGVRLVPVGEIIAERARPGVSVRVSAAAPGD